MTNQLPNNSDALDDVLMRLKDCAKHEEKDHIPFGDRCITKYQAKAAINRLVLAGKIDELEALDRASEVVGIGYAIVRAETVHDRINSLRGEMEK